MSFFFVRVYLSVNNSIYILRSITFSYKTHFICLSVYTNINTTRISKFMLEYVYPTPSSVKT